MTYVKVMQSNDTYEQEADSRKSCSILPLDSSNFYNEHRKYNKINKSSSNEKSVEKFSIQED